jgi:hypothetical protein
MKFQWNISQHRSQMDMDQRLNEEFNIKVDARALLWVHGRRDIIFILHSVRTKASKISTASYIMEFSSSLSVMKKAVVIQSLATQLQKKQVKTAM